uniref:Uncharacterized protein n=1 Tax=Solanum tuberosum TaxID=4113 RepID=M1DLF3_SOLTU
MALIKPKDTKDNTKFHHILFIKSQKTSITGITPTSVLNHEGKDQVGGKSEQSTHHRAVLRSITMSPNDPEHDDAEGWCKKGMNYTKGRITELIDDSD